MGFCLGFCKYVALCGVFFYLGMGLIMLNQPEYLKFESEDNTASGVSCFITAILELGLFIFLSCYEHRQDANSVTRPEYLQLEEERNQARQRESSIKGIDLMEMKQERRMEEEH